VAGLTLLADSSGQLVKVNTPVIQQVSENCFLSSGVGGVQRGNSAANSVLVAFGRKNIQRADILKKASLKKEKFVFVKTRQLKFNRYCY